MSSNNLSTIMKLFLPQDYYYPRLVEQHTMGRNHVSPWRYLLTPVPTGQTPSEASPIHLSSNKHQYLASRASIRLGGHALFSRIEATYFSKGFQTPFFRAVRSHRLAAESHRNKSEADEPSCPFLCHPRAGKQQCNVKTATLLLSAAYDRSRRSPAQVTTNCQHFSAWKFRLNSKYRRRFQILDIER